MFGAFFFAQPYFADGLPSIATNNYTKTFVETLTLIETFIIVRGAQHFISFIDSLHITDHVCRIIIGEWKKIKKPQV